MTISPLQPNNYVTKSEFNELDEYMHDGFDGVTKYCDNIDNVVTRVENKLDKLTERVVLNQIQVLTRIDSLSGKIANLTGIVKVKGDN